MRIKFVKVIEDGDQELMTVFKISLEQFFIKDKKHLSIRRKFFDPIQLDISAGLSMLHGFEAKFGKYDGGAFLQIDQSYRVLRSTNVLQIIEQAKGRRDALEKELIGSTVLTKHGGNKLYTIIRICYDLTPEDKFYLFKEKKEITYF